MCPTNSQCSPWFALYVKSRHEKTVASHLSGKGLTTFLAMQHKIYKHGKGADVPVFPGYVFCRLDAGQKPLAAATPGVISIVSNGHAPARIADAEIDALQRTLASGLPTQSWPYVAQGQRMIINSGPLRGIEGVVEDVSSQKWLILSVHLLCRSVAVKINRSICN